jgi:hypothetical protein
MEERLETAVQEESSPNPSKDFVVNRRSLDLASFTFQAISSDSQKYTLYLLKQYENHTREIQNLREELIRVNSENALLCKENRELQDKLRLSTTRDISTLMTEDFQEMTMESSDHQDRHTLDPVAFMTCFKQALLKLQQQMAKEREEKLHLQLLVKNLENRLSRLNHDYVSKCMDTLDNAMGPKPKKTHRRMYSMKVECLDYKENEITTERSTPTKRFMPTNPSRKTSQNETLTPPCSAKNTQRSYRNVLEPTINSQVYKSILSASNYFSVN